MHAENGKVTTKELNGQNYHQNWFSVGNMQRDMNHSETLIGRDSRRRRFEETSCMRKARFSWLEEESNCSKKMVANVN